MVEHGTAKCSWLDNVFKTTLRQGHVACRGTVESRCDGTVTCSGRRRWESIHLLVVIQLSLVGQLPLVGQLLFCGIFAYGEEGTVNYSGQGSVTCSGRETS